MLTDQQQDFYNTLYDCVNRSGHNNKHLDPNTSFHVGLADAYAMNCTPAPPTLSSKLKKPKFQKGKLQEVLAKPMAVAAGQKCLQASEGFSRYEVVLEDYEYGKMCDCKICPILYTLYLRMS